MLALELVIIIFFTKGICTASQHSDLDLRNYLQPNNVQDSHVLATDGVNCARECVQGDSRTCYYQFYAENYVTLNAACKNCLENNQSCDLPQCVTADGYKRGILTVNRRLPGPSIQVCEGDRIVVDVINEMSGRSFTIHWHGMFQKDTPYNDGVPMVTQCPIHEGNTFRYDFPASEVGTLYWHSHNGIQKIDGLQGSLVIRQPKEKELHKDMYDEDLPAHVITIMDWFHASSDDHFPGISAPLDPVQYSTFYLINGRGRYKDPNTGVKTKTPYSEFRVTPGKRYRFRVIGATCNACNARLSIEGHRLTLITTDGNDIKPVEFDQLNIFSGERYDFVLNANQEVKSYWIEVRAQGSPCKAVNNYQLAILKYEGSNDIEPTTVVQDGKDFNSGGVEVNPNNATCTGDDAICVAQLETIEDFNYTAVTSQPDVTIATHFGYYFPTLEELFESNTYERYYNPGAYYLYPYINNITFSEPPSPLLSQRKDIPAESFCPVNDKGIPYCDKDNCRCTHVIKVPLNALVQVILIDETKVNAPNHPIHLHGIDFHVMAMGYLSDMENAAEKIEQLMKNNSLVKSAAPVLKDTVIIPSLGYTIIRFIADNPGYWFFHCHFLFHHVSGMALTFQVGEVSEHLPVPQNFPKCGNYFPGNGVNSGNHGNYINHGNGENSGNHGNVVNHGNHDNGDNHENSINYGNGDNHGNHGNHDNGDNHENSKNYGNGDNHGNHGNGVNHDNGDNSGNHGNGVNHGNGDNQDNGENHGNSKNYGNGGNHGNDYTHSNHGNGDNQGKMVKVVEIKDDIY